jgi:HD-like signal output (HDOD) protein
MQRHNDSSVRKIVQSIDQISTLPTIYANVNELVDSPTSSASDLGKVISVDQGFTARLLRLVNSAFYGFPSRIDTVSRAVTIIGFKQLKELVLATSVMSMFKNMGNGISLSMEAFWKHSIGCGLASRILAIYSGQENPESYFVAGLLHDIGRMVLLDKFTDKYLEVFSAVTEKNRLVFEAESDVFGFTHAAVAEELVSLWNLPHTLKTAVGYHHKPNRAKITGSYADIVHIADILTHACEIGSSGEQFVPPLASDAWERVGLRKSILGAVFEKIEEQFEETYSFIMGATGR